MLHRYNVPAYILRRLSLKQQESGRCSACASLCSGLARYTLQRRSLTRKLARGTAGFKPEGYVISVQSIHEWQVEGLPRRYITGSLAAAQNCARAELAAENMAQVGSEVLVPLGVVSRSRTQRFGRCASQHRITRCLAPPTPTLPCDPFCAAVSMRQYHREIVLNLVDTHSLHLGDDI